ncbi:MAG TPA: TolC family protein [Candidatus Obscuribacterales bacterium]
MQNLTRPYRALVCTIACLLACSAAIGSLPARAEDLPQIKMPPQRPLGQDLPVYQSEMKLPELPELQDELNLQQARGLVLLYNPAFQSLAWEIRARQAALLQAGLAPNPSVDLTSEDAFSSNIFAGESFPELILTLSQPLLLGDKLGKQQTVARLNAELAGWDFERQRLEVLSEVTQRYIDVVQDQDSVALTLELQQVSEETLRVIQAEVDAGKVSPLEVTRAQVVLANSRLDVEEAQLALEQAREELASLWGGGGSDFERAAGKLELKDVKLPAFEPLLAALQQHPDIARWDTEFAQRQASLEFEESLAIPDLAVAGGLQRHTDSGDVGVNIGLSLPLPIWNRNQGNIAFASLRQQKAVEERERSLFSLRASLRGAYQRLRRAHGRLEMLQKSILPQAEEAFLGIRKGYQEGKFDYLDALEAQRNFFEARAQAVTALGDFYRALSEVEFLTGLDLAAQASTP